MKEEVLIRGKIRNRGKIQDRERILNQEKVRELKALEINFCSINGYKLLTGTIAVILVVLTAFPFLIMLSVSLQTMKEIYAPELVFIPEKAQFVNYVNAMKNGNWGRYMFNSIYITTIVVIISLFINSMTGYVFARINFKGKNLLFILLLVGMMIPPQVTMVPLFIMMRRFPLAGGNNIWGAGGTGLINTYTGLILPFIAGSFGVFLCRQFYMTFPKDLDNSALIDGCSRFKIFVRIYLPLSKPVLASLGILKFTGTWNEYTWPLIMTNSDSMKTVQIALTMFRDEAEVIWNQLMAATIISSAIIYILFLLLQKYFVAGILAGSLKE
ncbi:MAG TPA: carbohydrate ABC transporter permease [Clostridiaceae bacterium]|nr:carbohydrate ABC transporter permease [Clostridiaceae bacterium]